jgi:transposase
MNAASSFSWPNALAIFGRRHRRGAGVTRHPDPLPHLRCDGTGHLIKILWHDGIGMSLYAKRLERGRFIWPSPADGMVAITSAQLAYMLDGIDWRNPVRRWRPEAAS